MLLGRLLRRITIKIAKVNKCLQAYVSLNGMLVDG